MIRTHSRYIFLLITIFTFTGCKSSHHATVDFADGSYSGSLGKDGKKNGKGVYRWLDGSIYEGEYKNDMRHGKGRFMWANGETYSGDYRNDERTGKGVYLWPDGSRYEGDFLSGMRHGRGIFVSSSGVIYEGEWFDDLQHGAGTLTYPDGRIISGIWRYGNLVTKPAPLPSSSQKPTLTESPSPKVNEAKLINDSAQENRTLGEDQKTDVSRKTAPSSSTGLEQVVPPPDNTALKTDKGSGSQNLPAEQAGLTKPSKEVEFDTLKGRNKKSNDDKTDEAEEPDWIGTVAQAENIFVTDLIDGIDTVSFKKNGVPFSGSMRIVDQNGNAQGEVNLLNGRLHGEEVFFDVEGIVIERNFWSHGRPVNP